ncbi:MAG: hypothetical protein ACRENS_02530 [Candidatus Eiseniibacteriota bacterium]
MMRSTGPRTRVNARTTRSGLAALAALALLLLAGGARADGVAGLIGLLQPGSRPQLGLGGDPFLSPLADGSGWWTAADLALPPGTRVGYGLSAPLPAAGSLDSRALEMVSTGALRLRGRELKLAGLAGTRSESGQFSGSSGEVSLSGQGARLDGAARLTGLVPGTTLQGIAPLWSEGGGALHSTTGLGLRVAPARALSAQTHWARVRAPEQFSSDLFGEPVAASLNLFAEQWQTDVRIAPLSRLAFEGTWARSDFSPTAPRSYAFDYQLQPRGRANVSQASAEWRATPSNRALVRWSESWLDAGGDALWGGQRFGQLNYARAASRAWLLGLEHTSRTSRVFADAEVVSANGSARGSVESWPFTSVTVALLGLRGIATAQATADWWRLHVAGEHTVRGTLRASGGLSWYDANASGTLVTWRPTFLVFGQSDLQSSALPWRRAQLGLAALGLHWGMRLLSGSLEIQQPVFAKVFTIAGSGASGGGVGSAPGAAGASSLGSPARVSRTAATQIRISIERRM